MAHHAAWEGTEDGEEAVEEVATTIFQKIVRSYLDIEHFKEIQNHICKIKTVCLQKVSRETATKELRLFWAWAQGVGEIDKVHRIIIGNGLKRLIMKHKWCQ